jgi:hypothetical protein
MKRGRFLSPAGLVRALVGVALLAFVVSRLGLGEGVLARAAGWIALFSLFPFVGACVEAVRLRALFRAQAMRLPFALGFRLVLIAFAFNLCLPGGTGGDVLKLFYLASANPGRRAEIGTLVLLDRALALIAMLLAAVLALASSWGALVRHPALHAIGVVVAAVLAAGVFTLALGVRYGGDLAAHLHPRGRAGALAARVFALLGRFRSRARALAVAVGVTLAGHALLLLLHALAARALLGVDDLGVSAALASLGVVANALPLTPGGIGVGEAAFEQLFTISGVASGALLALVWRLGALPACAVGFALYGVGVRAEERALSTIEAADPGGNL